MAAAAWANSLSSVTPGERWEAKLSAGGRPLAGVGQRGGDRRRAGEKVGWAVNTAAKRVRSTCARKVASGTALSAGSGRTSRSASVASVRMLLAGSVPPT